MNHIGRLLRRLRKERFGLRLQDIGDQIGVSGQYLGQVERGLKGLSDRLMVEIAEKFGTDAADREALLLSMRDAAYRDRVPEGAPIVERGDRYLCRTPPPDAFLKLVQQSVKGLKLPSDKIAKTLGIPVGAWDLFITGRFHLRQEHVQTLANYLEGEAEGYYLLLAGYLLPDFTAYLGENTGRARTLLHLMSLPPEKKDDMFRIVKAFVNPYAPEFE